MQTKAGFVAIIGRANVGKSTLLNALLEQNLAMVSHKVNATRKRMNIIINRNQAQIIFIDTPGLHESQKLLNQFMLNESKKAMESCDLVVFMAQITDKIEFYKYFLSQIPNKKHIVILSKIDLVKNDEILNKLAQYAEFSAHYEAIIPISSESKINLDSFLDEIERNLPHSPYFFDTEIASDQVFREIYREKIREAIFTYTNKEIPYQSEVLILRVIEGEKLDKIYAKIITEKESQKIIIIGKNGNSIKNIGMHARKQIEEISDKKIFLKLEVEVKKGWSKNAKNLSKMGYFLEKK